MFLDYMPATSFDDLDETLRRAGAACDAAETHGTVCGALCAGVEDDADWVLHILDEASGSEAAREACRRALLVLRDDTHALLRSGTLEFELLLPDDEEGLADRTAALGEWCQGFLFGLGLAGARLDDEELGEETAEVLRDMGQIAQAGFEGSGGEEDEAAYVEIVEYVKVGVQLLYEELQPALVLTTPPSDTKH